MEYCQKILDKLKLTFKTFEGIELKEMTEEDFEIHGQNVMGFSKINLIKTDWNTDKNYRMMPIEPIGVTIRLNDDKGHTLTNDKLLGTLVHELGHCLTPYIQVKEKRSWYEDNHTDQFYINYLAVARQCYKLGIWKNKSLLQLRALKRLDQMNTCEDDVLFHSIT